MDPSLEEACSASGTLVLSCMPALSTMTSVWQTGRITPKEVLAVSISVQKLEMGSSTSFFNFSVYMLAKIDAMIYTWL